MKQRNIPALTLLTGLCAALSSGCLLLAEPPQQEYGETCVEDGNCPEGGYCGAPVGSKELLCLPLSPECAAPSDPVCGAYACNAELGFCYRSCTSSAECAGAGSCDGYDYETGQGVCAPMTTY